MSTETSTGAERERQERAGCEAVKEHRRFAQVSLRGALKSRPAATGTGVGAVAPAAIGSVAGVVAPSKTWASVVTAGNRIDSAGQRSMHSTAGVPCGGVGRTFARSVLRLQACDARNTPWGGALRGEAFLEE